MVINNKRVIKQVYQKSKAKISEFQWNDFPEQLLYKSRFNPL